MFSVDTMTQNIDKFASKGLTGDSFFYAIVPPTFGDYSRLAALSNDHTSSTSANPFRSAVIVPLPETVEHDVLRPVRR